jgi:putative flippase GtrA
MTLSERIKALFPTAQVIRYLIVGVINTVIGMGLYIVFLLLLSHITPAHIGRFAVTQARLAMTASILSTPINITISYFNYKLFVFRTRGNHLREWLKAFGVYGVSYLITLIALGGLTRFIEVLLHGRTPFGHNSPGIIAGVLLTGVTTIISYIGHKKVTFATKAS